MDVGGDPLAISFDGRRSIAMIDDIDDPVASSPPETTLGTPETLRSNGESDVPTLNEAESNELPLDRGNPSKEAAAASLSEFEPPSDKLMLVVEEDEETDEEEYLQFGGSALGLSESISRIALEKFSATAVPRVENAAEYVRVSRMDIGDISSDADLISERTSSAELRSRILRPDKLPTVEFEVVKINQRGRRQPRILRLTPQRVENVRGDEVSSSRTYLQILRVITINISTFSIEYADGSHPYTYVSNNCLWLVEELAHRVDLHTRHRSLLKFNAELFQEELRASNMTLIAPDAPDTSEEHRPVSRLTKLDLLTGTPHRQRLRDCAIKLLLEGELASVVSTFIVNAKKSRKRGQERAYSFRVFCDGIRFHISETNSEALKSLISPSFDPTQAQQLINDSIEYAMEQTILQHFSLELAQEYKKTFQENDTKFADQILSLADASQRDFDVPEDLLHHNAYIQVSIELSQIRVEALPSNSLLQLLEAVTALYLAAATVCPDKTLSADDFFPLFVHCVIQSQLKTPHALVAMIWALADPERLRGESGYYLTQLESAIFYITRGVNFQSKEEKST